ncbi:hypothetical protein GGR51DRAFT_564758 [Nemania sp. FL0031]|nr:hypothetical protein GGR51DRAFT_564758 [Nemania sp. FL0031]
MASIPIRRVEKRKDFLNTEVEYVMKPSKDAQASGMTEDFTMRLSTSKKRTMRVPASQFFDHLNHRGEVTDGFTQFDYLKNAFEVVKLVSTGTLSHLTWVRAFVQAHDALLADRQQIQRENGQWHTDCWATEWFFKVPPYTKFLGKMEDGRPREMRYSHEKETFEYVDGNP